MTEQDWLGTRNAQGMMFHLGNSGLTHTKSGKRRFRLFACGCCRAVWNTLPDERLRDSVEVAERFADGLATNLGAARVMVAYLASDSGPFGRSSTSVRVAIDMAIATTHPKAFEAAFLMTTTSSPLAGQLRDTETEEYLCSLQRCIFGNPFRPVHFDPSWRTSTTHALSCSMYASRDFSAAPILADALEDAGCDDSAILEHLRGENRHVKGCWVVDKVLAKQ